LHRFAARGARNSRGPIASWRSGFGRSGDLLKRRTAFNAGFIVRYSGEQDRLAAAETLTDAFTSVDAHFGWRRKLAHSGFELAIVDRNLTDTPHRNAVAQG
jgi:hypothetical protein